MFQCVPYSAALAPAWDELAAAQGSVFHTTAFRSVLLESFGYECAYHALQDQSGRLRALLPLVVGRNIGLQRAGVALPFINYLDICADGDEARAAAAAARGVARGKVGSLRGTVFSGVRERPGALRRPALHACHRFQV